MRYLPNTDADRKLMLESIGVESVDDLFTPIPEKVRLDRSLDLPAGLSEMELVRHMRALAGENLCTDACVSFLGAGVYDHYLPAAVDHMLTRGEFYTAYTPYQPEVSQGTLQAIFEFQTLVTQLTGMDVANASMYDGSTAMAEAALMAGRVKRKGERVLISEAVHPEYRTVVNTYIHTVGWEMTTIPAVDGATDVAALKDAMDDDVVAVLVQNPNFFGVVEAMDELRELSEDMGKAQLVVACDPISLALLKPPADYGADIVVGEGQPLGNPMSYGGPYLGFFASTQKNIRAMPGRIIGQTTDVEGTRGYVMTLQTREQHIRRERATSNICSNQALNALAATVYLSLMGEEGLREVAEHSTQKAHYAARAIAELDGYELCFDRPFFKEFVVRCPRPAGEIVAQVLDEGILAGVDLGRFSKDMEDCLLVAVTEKRTKDEIDRLVAALEGSA